MFKYETYIYKSGLWNKEVDVHSLVNTTNIRLKGENEITTAFLREMLYLCLMGGECGTLKHAWTEFRDGINLQEGEKDLLGVMWQHLGTNPTLNGMIRTDKFIDPFDCRVFIAEADRKGFGRTANSTAVSKMLRKKYERLYHNIVALSAVTSSTNHQKHNRILMEGS